MSWPGCNNLSKKAKGKRTAFLVARYGFRHSLLPFYLANESMRLFLILLMVVAGFGLAFQVAVNSGLRESLASPVLSASVSFIVGTLALLLIVALGQAGGAGAGAAGFRAAPWWAFLGGLGGASHALMSILTLPRVGAAPTITAAILGQQIGALLLDSFGWLGVQKCPDALRIAGALLLLGGVLLMQRK